MILTSSEQPISDICRSTKPTSPGSGYIVYGKFHPLAAHPRIKIHARQSWFPSSILEHGYSTKFLGGQKEVFSIPGATLFIQVSY